MQTRLAAKTLFTVALLASISFGQATSQAAFVLTPAGVSRGLSVTTFATGFPQLSSVGPLGMAFLPGGGVLVSDYPGNVRVFASNIDNQNAATATIGQNYGGGNAIDIAQVGNAIYMTQQSNGQVVQINNNGTLNQVILTGLPLATGMIASPTTGHLFVSSIGNNVVIDLNPITRTFRTLVSGNIDGLSISADGSILYGANNASGHIFGWRTSDGAQIYDSGFISGGVDGTAFGAGPLAGNVYVNTNSGTLIEVNLATNVQTLIGTGGSRGDFVKVDPTNNTLLITQSDRILRITGPFQNNTPPVVPAPPTLVLLALGSVLLGARRLRDLKSRFVGGA